MAEQQASSADEDKGAGHTGATAVVEAARAAAQPPETPPETPVGGSGLAALEAVNAAALAAVPGFREGRTPGALPAVDARFHQFKNRHPYHGFVEVEVEGERFVMLSTNDDLVAMSFFWHGPDAWEPMSMHLWRAWAQEADRVLDVGAFSGVYALLAAATAPSASVLAVEAARRTYGRLLSNIQANGFERRVRALNRAAASGPGLVSFNRFRGENILGIGDSFLAKEGLEVLSSEEQVETVSLDALTAQEAFVPDLIKIDVEGAELMVLEGMATLLSETRPRLLVEVTPETSEEAARVLEGHGYRIAAVDEAALTCLPLKGPMPRVGNLVAEHRGSTG